VYTLNSNCVHVKQSKESYNVKKQPLVDAPLKPSDLVPGGPDSITQEFIYERSSDLFKISCGTTLSAHRFNFQPTDNVGDLSNDYILRKLREGRCNFNPPSKSSPVS